MNETCERTVLIVGCGDIGTRIAALERAEGSRVSALARSPESARRLAECGIGTVMGDLDLPASLDALPGGMDALYHCAPPPAEGEDDPRTANLLTALDRAGLPKKLVYIGTSGVYGDCGGDWVTEERPPLPRSERGKRRAAAEARLVAWAGARGVDWAILRVPGIYGPGRLPLERIRRGVPVVREDESPWSNRIHADDLAAVCVLAARRGRGWYNVSDGHPSTMTDYFWRVADFAGLPRPPAISMEEARRVLGPGILSFLEESKRLDNGKMLRELGATVRYPNLDSGLAACRED